MTAIQTVGECAVSALLPRSCVDRSVDAAGTSVHATPALRTTFPLLSDFMRNVTASCGVLNAETGMAARTTFVIGLDGRIEHIEEGSSAIHPTGAATACQRDRKK